jgi:alpha-1,2-mannosyltransferase
MRSASLISGFRSASPCKRLWLGSGALATLLLTMIVGNHFLASDKSVTREMLGHDFLAFYTAGSFVRQGRAHDLYNLEAVRVFEQSTAHAAGLEVGKSFGPWWNPPFYALIFEPLAALPYAQALDLWR